MLSWLRSLFTRGDVMPPVPLDSTSAYGYLAGYRSSSGAVVNRLTVAGYPAVWRCLTLISQKVGRLPLDVYRRKRDGSRQVDDEHPAHYLLRQPNDYMGGYLFRQVLTSHALLHGNGYGYIFRDSNAVPTEMLVLDPEQTWPAKEGGNLVYVTKVGAIDNYGDSGLGQYRKLLPENVLHIRGLGYDGMAGYSVLVLLRESLGLGLALQRYGSIYFEHNGMPGTIIEMPGRFKDAEEVQQFRTNWARMHQGLDNSHRLAILQNGMKLVSSPINNETAQFLRTREFEVGQVANIFGVPQHKLGVNISTSYNSLEQENRAFLEDTLEAWLTAWEQECWAKLLTESQKRLDRLFIAFDRSSLTMPDHQTAANVMTAKVNNGLLTRNEARAEMNLPPVDDGDRLVIPTTVQFLDKADELPPTPTMPPGPPMPQQQQPEDPAEPADDEPGASEADPDSDRGRCQALLSSVLKRYAKRLAKSLEHHEPADWDAWAESHRAVLAESLAPVTDDAEARAGAILDGILDQLGDHGPGQWADILDGIDTDHMASEVLDGTAV